MAQFDVHRNDGPNRDAIPYVVIVQSSLFDEYRRRVVVPLVRQSHLEAICRASRQPGQNAFAKKGDFCPPKPPRSIAAG
jgi:hypothetical protein